MIYSFDLDGVLAYNSERYQCLRTLVSVHGPMQLWPRSLIEQSMASCSQDSALPLIELVRTLSDVDSVSVQVVSSRPPSTYEATIAWLQHHAICVPTILRSWEECDLHSTEWKIRTLLKPAIPIVHFDDDPYLYSTGLVTIVKVDSDAFV